MLLKFRDERNWKQFHTPKDVSEAISIEAGELLENFLWMNPEKSQSALDNPESRKKIEEELADVVMFSLVFANSTGIDVAAAIKEKIKKNAAKYPVEKAFGVATKYDQLK